MEIVNQRPLLLDLFCGAGGAAMGYHRAGFEVVGIDKKEQPRYPFHYIIGNALDQFIKYDVWEECAAIHASPPCQRYTALGTREDLSHYPDLVAATRAILEKTGKPWVIENVVGAPLRADLTLCAAAFGLRAYRHRIFESNVPLVQPPHPRHTIRVNRRGENRREHWARGGFITVTGDVGNYVGPDAMGIDWMTGNELSQAIPPAYTEYIGKQLLAHIQMERAA